MSKYQITQQNLPLFSKRLKKAIEKELSQEISLTKATLLIAKMLGNNSIHELQKHLITETDDKNLFFENIVYLPNPDNLQIITLDEGREKRYLKYVLVSNTFIERRGMSFYINDPNYASVNLFGEAGTFVNNLIDGLNTIKQNHNLMLLEYAIPAYSHMSNHLAICSKYYYMQDGKTISSDINK